MRGPWLTICRLRAASDEPPKPDGKPLPYQRHQLLLGVVLTDHPRASRGDGALKGHRSGARDSEAVGREQK
jgi:hypothetical protein